MRHLIRKNGYIVLLFIGLMSTACTQTQKKEQMKQEIKMDQVLRHMVLFKFNDDAAQAEVQKISDAFKALSEAIPVIKDFEWGLNDSPENFDQGFTHCYLVTFESVQDRDSVYTPHPAHQAFVASLQPFLEKVFVVDYWTNP
jgi:hypothetical protein